MKSDLYRKIQETIPVPMDKVASNIAALGIPGFIFILCAKFSGYVGAPSFTTALKTMGFKQDMRTGLLNLGAIACISKEGTEILIYRIAMVAIQQLYEQGEPKQSIILKIDQSPISASLKAKLREEVERMDWNGPGEVVYTY